MLRSAAGPPSPGDAVVEQPDGVHARQAGKRPGLALETLPTLARGQERGVQQLHAHRTPERLLQGAVDRARPAPAQHADERVLLVENLPEQRVVGQMLEPGRVQPVEAVRPAPQARRAVEGRAALRAP
jgi:hypothetical protein